MDKVIIYGAFEFVGFHLCKRLLEKGFCVEGFHFTTAHDLFCDEKRLEVGRNANFEEKLYPNQGKVTETSREYQDFLIISLYDWFMGNEAANSNFNKLLLQLPQMIKDQTETKKQLVYLLPIQLLTDCQTPEDLGNLRDFLKQTKQTEQCAQFYYLPTMYGPWQPPSFLFQRVILKQNIKEKCKIKEWPFDAIYINDALNPLIEKMESGETGSYLLESGIPDSWERCAEFLNLDDRVIKTRKHVKINMEDGIKRLALKDVTPLQESLAAQKEHVAYLDSLKNLKYP